MFGYKIFILKLMSIDGNTSTTITLQSKTNLIRIAQKYGNRSQLQEIEPAAKRRGSISIRLCVQIGR